MGDARNNINVLTSTIVVACPGGAGTISEIALALKNEKQVILLNFDTGAIFEDYRGRGLLFTVETPDEAIETIKSLTV
jgi:predicted Rossmann-fold nucleotide-binding protein